MRELVDSSQLSHFLYDSPRAKNAKQIDQRIRIQKFQQVKVTSTMYLLSLQFKCELTDLMLNKKVIRQLNEKKTIKKLFHSKRMLN